MESLINLNDFEIDQIYSLEAWVWFIYAFISPKVYNCLSKAWTTAKTCIPMALEALVGMQKWLLHTHWGYYDLSPNASSPMPVCLIKFAQCKFAQCKFANHASLPTMQVRQPVGKQQTHWTMNLTNIPYPNLTQPDPTNTPKYVSNSSIQTNPHL